ncbi:uncharacterized protein LOC110439519 [Tachysurus ichikawai]
MEKFNLENFITSPSLEQIELCRKQDLMQIADHFQIPLSKQSRKKELKRMLILRLKELQVLPTSNVEDVVEFVRGEAREQFSSGEKDKRSGGVDDEAEVEAEAKVGLPPFDPVTPSSVGSLEGARLKVRMVRLHYEAQERAQTRKAELNLKLEIRKLEIEADKQVKLKQHELEALKKMLLAQLYSRTTLKPIFLHRKVVCRPTLLT